MGVNAIVIVENSNNISLHKFIDQLKDDEWGQRAVDTWRDNEYTSWEEFEWEGKQYFSWMHTPRVAHIDLYSADNADDVDSTNDIQMTFLKIMCAVERIAGGPVYVGNDVLNDHAPDDAEGSSSEFWLPFRLDSLIPKWRDAAELPVEDPQLVF
jgi:hypothetical protein